MMKVLQQLKYGPLSTSFKKHKRICFMLAHMHMCVGHVCRAVCRKEEYFGHYMKVFQVSCCTHKRVNENCLETLSAPILSLPHATLHPQGFVTTFPITCQASGAPHCPSEAPAIPGVFPSFLTTANSTHTQHPLSPLYHMQSLVLLLI